MSALAKLFREKVELIAKGKRLKAQFGVFNGTNWVVTAVPTKINYYLTTVINGGEASTLQEARLKPTVSAVAGQYVILTQDDEGTWEISDYDGKKADEFSAPFGGVAITPPYAQPPISPRQFDVGLCHVFNGGVSMVVYASATNWTYGTSQGYFAGGTIDLSANVPSAGLCRLVKICLNPATNSLVAVNGATFALGMFNMLNATQLANIPHPNLMPLCGVRIKAGQTVVNNDADFIDCRHFLHQISVMQPLVITGSRKGNLMLQNLLSALNTQGVIVDQTEANVTWGGGATWGGGEKWGE